MILPKVSFLWEESQNINTNQSSKESFISGRTKIISFLLIFLASLLTRNIYIETYKKVGFDECYFGSFINFYLNNTFFIDVHPPFGRLFLTFTSYLMGYRGKCQYFPLFKSFNDESCFIPRKICAFYSSLCPPIIYFIMSNFRFSQKASFVTAFLVIFEESMILEGRQILTDGILHLLFCLSLCTLSLLTYIKPYTLKWNLIFILTSIVTSLTCSTKFTALMLFPLIFLFIFTQTMIFYNNNISFPIFLKFIICVVVSMMIFFVTLYLSFLAHIKRLKIYNAEDSLYKYFTKYEEEAWNEFSKCKTLNQKIEFTFNTLISFNSVFENSDGDFSFFSSKWYKWPFMNSPLIVMNEYFQKRNVALFHTNFASSFLSFLFVFVIYLPYILFTKPHNMIKYGISLFFIIGYIVSYVPFCFVDRTTFSYHYILPLIFLYFTVGASIDVFNPFHDTKAGIIFMIISFLSFLIFLPMTYPLKFSETNVNILYVINKKWFDAAIFWSKGKFP